MMDEAMRDKNS